MQDNLKHKINKFDLIDKKFLNKKDNFDWKDQNKFHKTHDMAHISFIDSLKLHNNALDKNPTKFRLKIL